MSTEQLVYLATAVTLILGVIGIVKFVVVPLWRLTRMAFHFFDAWNGEVARDGLAARPGVVDRIVAIEYQLHPNRGGSIKDAVGRIEAKVDTQAAVAVEVKAALEQRQDNTEAQIGRIWESLASRDITQAATHLAVVADRAEAASQANPTSDK